MTDALNQDFPAKVSKVPKLPSINLDQFCARRGNQWLSREDLQAHLAALLRVENVGLLLGAGASIGDLGGKSMKQVWQDFEKSYPESYVWLLQEGFISKETSVNVEHLADELEIAALEWSRASHPKTQGLSTVRANLQRSIIKAALLNEEWWKSPDLVGFDTPSLANHRQVLKKLTAARQPGQPAPWVFTTNYDLAVEWAAESVDLKIINGFDGLHRRSFSPHNFDLGWRNVLARGEARFGTYHIYLAKVHGSLTWYKTDDDFILESPASSRWPLFEDFLKGTGNELTGVLVLPSTTKYLQTVGFVLGELFRRLAEFLARPQSCLFVSGYSFSDDHINRLLLTALQNPTLHLVVYLPEVVRDGDRIDASNASPWARRVLEMGSPQVTVVGGGKSAHFASLASDLPDPAIYDEHAIRMRTLLRELREDTSSLKKLRTSK